MLAEISIPRSFDISTAANKVDIHKHNLTMITSYNWLDCPTPTIAVPGSAAIWSPPQAIAIDLSPDKGLRFIDQNAFRLPLSPLEPLFRACPPLLEFNGLDIITDRNNLRKLLSFITGSNRDAFEMQLQRLGSITLFQRCEPASTEFVEEFRGYGCEFEKMFTRPGVRGSRAHHRVVAYEFGGLQMMVRFEVDAIVAPDAVDTLDVGEEDYTASSQTLRVHKTGGLPYSTVDAEIKTRATHRRLVLKDVMPQLWFSQTERLLVGYHRDGVFGEVWENDVEATGEMEKWEQRHRKDLRRLVALLRIIVDAVEKVGGRAELVSSGRKNLKVRKVEGSDLVPADVKAALEK